MTAPLIDRMARAALTAALKGENATSVIGPTTAEVGDGRK